MQIIEHGKKIKYSGKSVDNFISMKIRKKSCKKLHKKRKCQQIKGQCQIKNLLIDKNKRTTITLKGEKSEFQEFFGENFDFDKI